MDLVQVRQDLESLQGGGCPKPVIESYKGGSPRVVVEPEESSRELESVSGAQRVLEKESLRRQADLFSGLDLVSVFSDVIQKEPCAIHCRLPSPAFAVDACQGTDTFHRRCPPEKQMRVLVVEASSLPGKRFLNQ